MLTPVSRGELQSILLSGLMRSMIFADPAIPTSGFKMNFKIVRKSASVSWSEANPSIVCCVIGKGKALKERGARSSQRMARPAKRLRKVIILSSKQFTLSLSVPNR